MTTAYTTLLQLALPATGELDGTWGDTVNNSITQMVDEAVAGRAVINTWTAAAHTLTTANGATSEARCAIISLEGAPGAAATVTCPTSSKVYIVTNSVTGSYDVTFKTASGTGATLTAGQTRVLICDGTNVVDGQSYVTAAGTAATATSATSAGKATNIAGGTAGKVPYQSGADTTAFTAVGTAGQVLTSQGTGAPTWTNAAAGLNNFTDSISTSSPNATVPAAMLKATNAATNVDAVFSPKGTGAVLAQSPDSTATGGNKRGANAVDLQPLRSSATMVASGTNAVVAGGENNIASAAHSAVGGGSTNTASGTQSVIAGGYSNTASSIYSTVAGGSTNRSTATGAFVGAGTGNWASNSDAFIGGGGSNNCSGSRAVIAGGSGNRADGTESTVPGGAYATTRAITGAYAWAGSGAVEGQQQEGQFVLKLDTTNATPGTLTTTGAAVSTTNMPVMPNNSTYHCRIRLTARNTTSGDSKSWTGTALIKRGANAAATALVGSPTLTSDYGDASLSTTAVALTADTTRGALAIGVTGIATTNIRWTALLETVESTN